jgi:predicted NBD/HSP70 family sugar kinase
MELLNLAEDGDEKAIKALNRQASYLGQGLSIIASVLSPEVILLTGGLTTSWKRFGPVVEKELAKDMLAGEAPRISVMTDVESDRLRGAAALVLQRHSGSNRQAANGTRPKKA